MDDCYFKAVNLRRQVIVENEAVTRSTIQQIQQIIEFKQRKESMSPGNTWNAETLSAEWNKHVVQISNKYVEELRPTWIEYAVRIHNTSLRMETEYGKKSPLNSVYALETITSICKTKFDILWCLDVMKDGLVHNGFAPSGFSMRLLGSKRGKGMARLYLFKKLLLDYMST